MTMVGRPPPVAARPTPARRTGDGGAAAATTLAVTTIAAVLAIMLALAAGRIVLVAQASQATADVVALAVMSGSRVVGGPGPPSVDAGRRLAEQGGMTLHSVDVAGWPDSVVVTLTTTIQVAWIAIPNRASAGATTEPGRR